MRACDLENPSWHHGSDLVVSWSCHRTGSLSAWMLSSYALRSGRNCGIMLASTAPYCASHVTFADPQVREFEMQNIKKPCITIVGLHHLVTQLLPISCRYMYTNFAWRCNMYYLGLTHLIARSAPSCNLIIAYLLPVYVCRFRILRLEV